MSVFTCYEYTSITNFEFLEKIKDAMSAGGWTIDQFSNACQWQETSPVGYYDFDTGNEGSLIVSSSGYGSQTLHYRLRTLEHATLTDTAWLMLGAFRSGTETLDHTSAIIPFMQGNWNDRNSNKSAYMSIPRAISKCYIFAYNKYFVVASIIVDSSYCLTLAFGSPELIDTAKTDCQFAGYNLDDGYSYNWSAQLQKDPFWKADDSIYYNGSVPSSPDVAYNIQNTSYHGDSFSGTFHSYVNILNSENLYSDIQPLFKPMVYCKNTSGYYEPIGTFPIFRAKFLSEYTIGQIKTYGTKKYRMFPSGVASASAGFAVRIA